MIQQSTGSRNSRHVAMPDRPYANGLRPIISCCMRLLGPHLINMDVTVEEQVNTVLVGQQLHGSAHLLRPLVVVSVVDLQHKVLRELLLRL